MQNRKKQRHTKRDTPPAFKLHLIAEIIKFPNDPERQPDLNAETRWLMLGDKMLLQSDEELEEEAS